MQIAVPEAIIDTDSDDCVVTEIAPHKKSHAVGIGPGLGTDSRTIDALGAFLRSRREPVVLDADALNCLAQRPMYLSNIPANSIITPNANEFDRLFGDCYTEEERLKKALDASSRLKIVIVLKGHYTKVIRPDGKIDISLQPFGRKHTEDFSEYLLRYLEYRGGRCRLGDKSSAEEIREQFQVSKKTYKRAIGDLTSAGSSLSAMTGLSWLVSWTTKQLNN